MSTPTRAFAGRWQRRGQGEEEEATWGEEDGAANSSSRAVTGTTNPSFGTRQWGWMGLALLSSVEEEDEPKTKWLGAVHGG
uniref:Uncharacterized protein n=1 Tax=Oryza barthii TaxID=65489 RepID=A0A0D3HPB3_9ORYZ